MIQFLLLETVYAYTVVRNELSAMIEHLLGNISYQCSLNLTVKTLYKKSHHHYRLFLCLLIFPLFLLARFQMCIHFFLLFGVAFLLLLLVVLSIPNLGHTATSRIIIYTEYKRHHTDIDCKHISNACTNTWHNTYRANSYSIFLSLSFYFPRARSLVRSLARWFDFSFPLMISICWRGKRYYADTDTLQAFTMRTKMEFI